MDSYILLSPAKINLSLKIVGKRDDGYHLLESIVQKISLFDVIKISFSNKDKIKFFSSDVIEENNTILKALKKFKLATNIKQNFSIEIYKKIPAGAGLGGGSSNAATVLKFLNFISGKPLTHYNLIKIGEKIGADVPLFIYNYNSLLMKGIGEQIEKVDKIFSNHFILIVKPEFSVSTKWAYKKLNFELTNKIKSINRGCFKISDFVNDLEIPVISKYNEIKKLKDILKSFNAEISLMSGSGSSVFGLYSNKINALNALKYIKNQNKHYKIYFLKFL